jgi:beta propeller repeat protein
MKMWVFKVLGFIFGMWAIGLVVVVLPGSVLAQGPIEILEEFMISPVGGFGFQAISGDMVAFDSNGDIYGYDLSTHTGFRITHHGGAQLPDISGDTIVWNDHRNGNWDIYGYDLSEAREFRITHHAADQKWPVIDGHTVVWVDWRNGGEPLYGYDLYGYDLASGTEFRVSGQSAPTTCPAISGNVVVWSDRRYGGWDVYGYDLGSDTETQITSTWASSPYCPAISNGVIVLGEGNSVIGIDLSGNFLFETATLSLIGIRGRPAVEGNLVVWQEGPAICAEICPSDIVGYDINSDHTLLIASNGHQAKAPTISGDVVVWREFGSLAFYVYPRGVYVSKLLETAQRGSTSPTLPSSATRRASLYAPSIAGLPVEPTCP